MNKVYQLYLYSTNYSVENKREVYEGPMGVFLPHGRLWPS